MTFNGVEIVKELPAKRKASALYLVGDGSAAYEIHFTNKQKDPINVGNTSMINSLIAAGAGEGGTGADGTDGTDGREVSLRVNSGFIQWQYTGDVSWTNLIPLSELEGAQGPQGIQGVPGPTGPAGAGTTEEDTILYSIIF